MPDDTSPELAIKPLVISAPFGNYIQPGGATATLGTFTAAPRPGRAIRILRTVRYYRRLRAWVNKIGLRNPGMPSLVAKAKAGKVGVGDKLVSVHGFTADDWWALLDQIGEVRPLGVELNMSCPNVGEVDWPPELFARAVGTGVPVVVKLPPVNYEGMVEQAWDAGVRWFHACNTLPVPAGGLSGKPLMPVALRCVRDLRGRCGGAVSVIGGGGITTPADIDAYADAGARRFAIGTRCFNPWLLVSTKGLGPLIERASQRGLQKEGVQPAAAV